MTNGKKKLYAIKRAATGLGLFAVERIPRGKRIIEYVGPLISNAEVERMSGKYFFGVNTKWAIDGRAHSNTARYINHSCRPNAEAFISGHRIWVWSKKEIKAGEEITINYGKEYFDDHIKPIGCKCEPCRNKPRTKR
ncbi:MAG TPA: SET domain-containing protein [Pyrinomonadaceae bacterium]|nr:SET domain-containing protein [Pyrinomonadaceae bacterium]